MLNGLQTEIKAVLTTTNTAILRGVEFNTLPFPVAAKSKV
jgi:hypothetical protein